MLQELLNLGLVDIGADDSRFQKMQNAANALSRHFVEKPELLVTATLIALDDDTSEGEPFFDLVEKLVIVEWVTLRNTHVNRPRQLLRSITLDAIASTISNHPAWSGLVWNIAMPRIQHKQTRLGKASSLIEKLLQSAFSRSETEALEKMGMQTSLPSSGNKKKSASASIAKVDFKSEVTAKEFLAEIFAAAGPTDNTGTTTANPNPVWPNSAQQWSHEFAPRMAAAIAKAVNLGTSRMSSSVGDSVQSNLSSFETQLKDKLNAVEALESAMARIHQSSRMRLDLLWWSQARYSNSQHSGYTSLNESVAAFVAAVDLSKLVPPLSPASVCHVLGETVTSFTSMKKTRKPVKEHLKNIAESKVDIVDSLAIESTNGRIPLVSFTNELLRSRDLQSSAIVQRTGINPELTLTYAELAMWLFREIQAIRIARGAA